MVWPIPAGEKYERNLPAEPKQTAPRTLEGKNHVPLDALYKCWHIYSVPIAVITLLI